MQPLLVFQRNEDVRLTPCPLLRLLGVRGEWDAWVLESHIKERTQSRILTLHNSMQVDQRNLLNLATPNDALPLIGDVVELIVAPR